MPSAVAEPVAIAYGVALYTFVFAPAAVAALKGHGIWLLVGFIFAPVVWWYAALRLAMPGSWWDRYRYGPEKQTASRERYGDRRARPWLAALAVALLALPLLLGFTLALLSG
jgi:hypothetical protein